MFVTGNRDLEDSDNPVHWNPHEHGCEHCQSLEEWLVELLKFTVGADTLEFVQHFGKNGTCSAGNDGSKDNGKLVIAFLVLRRA
jgi:hypothetical protein